VQYAKCQIALIRCSKEQTTLVIAFFPCQKVDFPIKYLSLPLSTTKLPKSALQPLIDRIADKMPTGKGRIFHHNDRLTHIKTMMCVVPVYTSININLLG
jgi:hypothetical protein